MTSLAITQHFATAPPFTLAHKWWDTTHATDCGLPCAYSDGPHAKLATGWIAAPLSMPRCPTCFPREL